LAALKRFFHEGLRNSSARRGQRQRRNGVLPAHRKPVYSLAFKRRKIHMTAELFSGLPRETLCGNRRAVVKSAGSVSAE